MIASHFDTQEVNVTSREFHTITGTYKGKVSQPFLMALSDNIERS